MATVLAGLLTMAMMPSAEAPDCWAARIDWTVSSSAPDATAATASSAAPSRAPTTSRFMEYLPFLVRHLEPSPPAPRVKRTFYPGGAPRLR